MKWALGAILLSLINVACQGEVIVVESSDSTSKDIPLKFVLEKSNWDNEDLLVWGTVKNPSQDKFKFVKVIITAKGQKGEFIGRKSFYIEPTDIGPGQVGYVEGNYINCEGRKPAKIEYSITGDK